MNRLLTTLVLAAAASTSHAAFTGLVVFGDSLSDTGNIHNATNILLTTRRPANPWYTTGRWSNGRDNTALAELNLMQAGYTGVWHERMAQRLNIPAASTARRNTTTPMTLASINYAHGGATTGDGTDGFGITRNLGYQVSEFLTDVGTGQIPTDKLYVMWAGSNDLRDAARAPNTSSQHTALTALTAVENMENQIELLSQHVPDGQRITVVWPNVPPLGDTPEMRAMDPYIRDAITYGAEVFREAQLTAIGRLSGSAPNVEVKRIDIFGMFQQLIAGELAWRPGNVTTNIVTVANGDYSSRTMTVTRNAAVPNGADPDTYVFWDQIHPTSRTHQELGDYVALFVPAPGPVGLLLTGLGMIASRRRRAA
jgi:phospholipase/lecithinase/hemolysin